MKKWSLVFLGVWVVSNALWLRGYTIELTNAGLFDTARVTVEFADGSTREVEVGAGKKETIIVPGTSGPKKVSASMSHLVKNQSGTLYEEVKKTLIDGPGVDKMDEQGTLSYEISRNEVGDFVVNKQ